MVQGVNYPHTSAVLSEIGVGYLVSFPVPEAVEEDMVPAMAVLCVNVVPKAGPPLGGEKIRLARGISVLLTSLLGRGGIG